MLVFVALFFTACTGGSNETNHSDAKEMSHSMDKHDHAKKTQIPTPPIPN